MTLAEELSKLLQLCNYQYWLKLLGIVTEQVILYIHEKCNSTNEKMVRSWFRG